jgi:copper chaperone CopZ
MSTTTTRIAVEGMTCNGCVRSVTNALSRVAGVVNVDVSLSGKLATVEHEAAKSTPASLIEAVQAAGFEARPA